MTKSGLFYQIQIFYRKRWVNLIKYRLQREASKIYEVGQQWAFDPFSDIGDVSSQRRQNKPAFQESSKTPVSRNGSMFLLVSFDVRNVVFPFSSLNYKKQAIKKS